MKKKRPRRAEAASPLYPEDRSELHPERPFDELIPHGIVTPRNNDVIRDNGRNPEKMDPNP